MVGNLVGSNLGKPANQLTSMVGWLSTHMISKLSMNLIVVVEDLRNSLESSQL